MLLLSRARTEGTSEGGRERGMGEFGMGESAKGQIEMKIASFKQSFKAVGSLAKSYDPHKGDFVHAPEAYGKSEGEVCPAPKKGLS